MKRTKVFVVSGPSGVGKTTVVAEALNKISPEYPIHKTVTYTSRPLRDGETDGEEYHSVSEAEFKGLLADGFFAEWSTSYGTFYGTPASAITGLKDGEACVLVIDRLGAKNILKKVPEAVLIWITIPNLDVLRERLEERGLNREDQIEKRLKIAELEIAQEYSDRLYRYHVVNIDFDETVEKVVSLFKSHMDELQGEKH